MGGKLSPNIDVDLNADIDGDMNLDVRIPTGYSISIDRFPPVDITVRPLDVSIRMKEIPSTRAHFPLDYKVGFSLLGRELACVHFCGQGQVITEPYRPYPCEPQSANWSEHQSIDAVRNESDGKG